MLYASVFALVGALAAVSRAASATKTGSAAAAAPTGASGMTFINPDAKTVWASSQGQVITWTAPGPNDPPLVDFLLINNVNRTLEPIPFMPLANNVPTKNQKWTLTAQLEVANGYTILMVDPANSATIYAQGGRFNVTSGPDSFVGMPLASQAISVMSASIASVHSVASASAHSKAIQSAGVLAVSASADGAATSAVVSKSGAAQLTAFATVVSLLFGAMGVAALLA